MAMPLLDSHLKYISLFGTMIKYLKQKLLNKYLEMMLSFNLKIQNTAIQISLVWVLFEQNVSSGIRRDFATM